MHYILLLQRFRAVIVSTFLVSCLQTCPTGHCTELSKARIPLGFFIRLYPHKIDTDSIEDGSRER